MAYLFNGLSMAVCDNIKNGRVDANGQKPETVTSDGGGKPCRCCLADIPEGREMHILAHRPFDILSAYAETGPIFICADCEPYATNLNIPPVLATRPRHLFKGYSADDRIVYGTGEIVETTDITGCLDRIFANPDVKYVHVRSATNNCFTLRVDQVAEI